MGSTSKKSMATSILGRGERYIGRSVFGRFYRLEAGDVFESDPVGTCAYGLGIDVSQVIVHSCIRRLQA